MIVLLLQYIALPFDGITLNIPRLKRSGVIKEMTFLAVESWFAVKKYERSAELSPLKNPVSDGWCPRYRFASSPPE